MKYFSKKFKFAVPLFAVLLLCLYGSVFGETEDNLKKSFNVSSGGTLNIDTSRGSIEVRSGNSNSVEVEVTRKVRTSDKKAAQKILDDFKIEFDQRGNDVYITADYDGRNLKRLIKRIFNRLQVKYVVTVPKKYSVDLHTRGGSIAVSDLEGQVLSRTSGGSLRFENIEGRIQGNTSGGSIVIGSVNGNVNVHTSGGGIKIDHAQGEVEAKTSGGSITVNEVLGTIQAKTSGGSIKAYISQQPKSNCRLTTSGGSVTVYLNDNIAVNLDAHTSGGSVRTDFPVTIKGKINRRSLQAKINGGGPELYLRTSGGSIYLKEK